MKERKRFILSKISDHEELIRSQGEMWENDHLCRRNSNRKNIEVVY